MKKKLVTSRFENREAGGECYIPVLDDPVVLSSSNSSVSSGKNTVVEVIRSARGAASKPGVIHSRGVKLEEHGGGVDGDGYGLLGNGGLEGSLVVHGDVGIAGELGNKVSGLLIASGGSRLVGSSLLRDDTSGTDDILEGPGHETTSGAGALSAVDAVNELLLRELNKGVSSKEVGTLHGSSGGEGPARSTLSLVLDGSDGSLGGPVNGGREGKHLSALRSLVLVGGSALYLNTVGTGRLVVQ